MPLAIPSRICQKTNLKNKERWWGCEMALLDSVLNGWGTPTVIGIGAVIAAPLLLPVVGAVARPVAKGLIYGRLWLMESLQGTTGAGGTPESEMLTATSAEYDTNGVTTTLS
jgi:hypothetical protein